MAKFTLNGYNSYSGCDIVVTARLNKITGTKKELKEKVYTLGSLQTLSVSTHQDKKNLLELLALLMLLITLWDKELLQVH